MEKKVKVTIEGLQYGNGEDAITTRSEGIYYQRKDNHYILFEEQGEGEAVVKTSIRISPDIIDIIKNGGIRTHMIFDPKEATSAIYHTPYGSIKLRISTVRLSVKHKDDNIIAALRYSLYEGNSLLSENRLIIRIENN